MTSTSEFIHVDGPAGQLEGLLEAPPASIGAPTAVGVVCHPHPQHGGTMNNKVAFTLARTLNLFGAAAVRFNYRGVGASEGSFDNGEGERDDAIAVARWARTRVPDVPLFLAGFSFGACMAVRASAAVAPSRLILVAPAIDRYGLEDVAVSAPVVLAQGMDDDVVDGAAALRWARGLPGPVTVLEFEEAGHFFHGKQVALRTRMLDALQAQEAKA